MGKRARLFLTTCPQLAVEPPTMIRSDLCPRWARHAFFCSPGLSLPRNPGSLSPSIRGPTPCGRTGPTSTAAGNSGSTPQDEGLRAGWEKPDAGGFRPHDRRPVPLGERALGHPPTEGRPEVGWYRRTFRVPADFPARSPGLAPLRGGRLAGRRLGQRQEGRRARGRIHALRVRHHRRRRSRRRERRGRPRRRPDRSQPADRQADPLVHAQLGDLADGLARSAARARTSRLPDHHRDRAGPGHVRGRSRRIAGRRQSTKSA